MLFPWTLTVSVRDETADPVANLADPSELNTSLSSSVTSAFNVEISPSLLVTCVVRLLRALDVAI